MGQLLPGDASDTLLRFFHEIAAYLSVLSPLNPKVPKADEGGGWNVKNPPAQRVALIEHP